MDRELINSAIYKRINGREVIVEFHDSVFGAVKTGPFTFDFRDGIHQRVVQREDFSMIMSFEPDHTTVSVQTYDRIRDRQNVRTHHVDSVIPIVQDDGVIHLDLWRHPKFDIDVIRYLYDHIDTVNPKLVDALGLHNHPFIHLEDVGGILPMLYEVELEDCFGLTQLGHYAKLETSMNLLLK